MKYRIAVLLLIYSSLASIAQTSKIYDLQGKQTKLIIQNKSLNTLEIKNEIDYLKIDKIKTKHETFISITIPEYSKNYDAGYPNIPVLQKLIEVPYNAKVITKIIGYENEYINLNNEGFIEKLIPAQPPISKSSDPKTIPLKKNNSIYSTNDFFKHNIIEVQDIGIMRGVRIARLTISPFFYNPVSNVLKILNNLHVEIIFENADYITTQTEKNKYFSPQFENTLKSITNYSSIKPRKDTISRYPLKYIIVTDSIFSQALQPFIEWKIKEGYNVITAYKNSPQVGSTASSIRNYLSNLYYSATTFDPAQTYVLLVGDIDKIPAFPGTTDNHVTDLYYAEYTGDFFPEAYFGRLSVVNVEQLENVITKTLEYEQYTMPNPLYLNEALLVAGMDATYAGVYANGQINYATQHYFNQQHGINPLTYLYPTSGSHSADIINKVSSGIGFGTYTAHCTSSGWANPAFNKTHIPSLQNAHKYGLLIGNCCLSLKFDVDECFGEALLRAKDKGVIGYIGASNETDWDEDYYWSVGVGNIIANPIYEQTTLGAYDRLFHDHGEPQTEWYVTQGQIIFAGNLAVTQSASPDYDLYWEIYHLMGDPSLIPYLSKPDSLWAVYNPFLVTGTTQLNVTTKPGAYVALSMDNILYDAKLSDNNGIANLSFTPLMNSGTAHIVVTKQFYAPFIDTINVSNSAQPYITLSSFFINDSAMNNNGKADYGETIKLSAIINNLGMFKADSITAILRCNDPIIKITDSIAFIPFIDSLGSYNIYNDLEFTIDSLVSNLHKSIFSLSFYDTKNNNWTSSFYITINAPKFNIKNIQIIDTSGNNNGYLDTSETAILHIPVYNNGNAVSQLIISSLTSLNKYITITKIKDTLNILAPDSFAVAKYNIYVKNTCPVGEVIKFNFLVKSGEYNYQQDINLQVGFIVEDWETANFTKFNWQRTGRTNLWFIDDSIKYEGKYALRSGKIKDNDTCSLIINFRSWVDDTVSFYKKVSCEEGYGEYWDFLAFYINNNLMGFWDGEQDWSRASFPLSMGTHSLKWSYIKDSTFSEGSDCAWLDYILLPAHDTLVTIQYINNSINTIDFSLYPNPTNNYAMINFSLPINATITLSVFNSMGHKINDIIFQKLFDKGNYSIPIDLREFLSGIYFIKLQSNNNVIIKKLIKLN